MTAWRRWQDYATMLFGVLLFVSPFVFGATSNRTAALSAYVLGILLFLSGIIAAATREARRSPILNAPGVVAIVTFLAPWVLGFSTVTAVAWTAWVTAILTVVVAATFILMRRPQTAA
ncbi:MAG: hypothetical protein E6J53_05680 [Chloroflexi bacterium]|nr:MAG: hypothetical protein E6J53_05680 [Chloroflexota bacterium]